MSAPVVKLALRAAGAAAPAARNALARTRAPATSTRALASYAGARPPPQQQQSRSRQFRGIYFGRPTGCINMRVVQPRFRASGPSGSFHILSKSGSVVLEVAPTLPPEAGATGRYDWANKLTYSLSPLDITYLASVGPAHEAHLSQTIRSATDGAATVRTLTIAPDAGAKEAGRPSHRLTVTSSPDGGGGAPSSRVEMWLSVHDLSLLKHLAGTSLPTITGWAVNLDPGLFDPSHHLEAAGGYGGGGGGGSGDGGDGGAEH